MSDANPGPGAADEIPGPPKPSPADELTAVLDWARQVSAAGGTFSRLFALELRLALADSRRLLLLGILMLPLVVLAWTGLSVLVAWLVYQYTLSAGFGLTAFFLLQMTALVAMVLAGRRYSRSLSLPATRRHLKALLTETRDESRQTEH